MTDNCFEGLTCLTARGNTADLAALVDHLATEYLIVYEHYDSPLAFTIHVAPPTPHNKLIVKLLSAKATRKRSKLVFKKRG